MRKLVPDSDGEYQFQFQGKHVYLALLDNFAAGLLSDGSTEVLADLRTRFDNPTVQVAIISADGHRIEVCRDAEALQGRVKVWETQETILDDWQIEAFAEAANGKPLEARTVLEIDGHKFGMIKKGGK